MSMSDIVEIRRRIDALLAQTDAIERKHPEYNICPKAIRKKHKDLCDEIWGLRHILGVAA